MITGDETLKSQRLKAWLDTRDTLERWRQTPPEKLKDRIRLTYETEEILQYALAIALRAESQKAYNMSSKEIEDRLAEVKAERIQLQEILQDVSGFLNSGCLTPMQKTSDNDASIARALEAPPPKSNQVHVMVTVENTLR